MKRNVSLNSLIIIMALLLILIIFFGEAIHSRRPMALQTFEKGLALPQFSLPQLFNPEKSLTQNDLKGQVCLLNFWASWCVACIKEHKTLNVIRVKYQIPIFGINFKDDPDKAKAWLAKGDNPYQIIGEDRFGRAAKEFEVFGIPITYVIDKHGVLRYRYIGTLTVATWEDDILPLVRKLEKENP